MIKKKIVFLFSLLLLTTLLGAGCVNNKDTNTAVQNSNEANIADVQINADLVITMDGQSTAYATTIPNYSSVLDVLRKSAADNNLALDTQESSYGVYVNGLAGKTGGDNNKYWLYYVNGESATIGVADYIINEGDSIEFKFE
ncbi:MAG: DUF4430 domain-containing protein [Patescibacteria group bacterium]|jgi:hypothetical protein